MVLQWLQSSSSGLTWNPEEKLQQKAGLCPGPHNPSHATKKEESGNLFMECRRTPERGSHLTLRKHNAPSLDTAQHMPRSMHPCSKVWA